MSNPLPKKEASNASSIKDGEKKDTIAKYRELVQSLQQKNSALAKMIKYSKKSSEEKESLLKDQVRILKGDVDSLRKQLGNNEDNREEKDKNVKSKSENDPTENSATNESEESDDVFDNMVVNNMKLEASAKKWGAKLSKQKSLLILLDAEVAKQTKIVDRDDGIDGPGDRNEQITELEEALKELKKKNLEDRRKVEEEFVMLQKLFGRQRKDMEKEFRKELTDLRAVKEKNEDEIAKLKSELLKSNKAKERYLAQSKLDQLGNRIYQIEMELLRIQINNFSEGTKIEDEQKKIKEYEKELVSLKKNRDQKIAVADAVSKKEEESDESSEKPEGIKSAFSKLTSPRRHTQNSHRSTSLKSSHGSESMIHQSQSEESHHRDRFHRLTRMFSKKQIEKQNEKDNEIEEVNTEEDDLAKALEDFKSTSVFQTEHSEHSEEEKEVAKISDSSTSTSSTSTPKVKTKVGDISEKVDKRGDGDSDKSSHSHLRSSQNKPPLISTKLKRIIGTVTSPRNRTVSEGKQNSGGSRKFHSRRNNQERLGKGRPMHRSVSESSIERKDTELKKKIILIDENHGSPEKKEKDIENTVVDDTDDTSSMERGRDDERQQKKPSLVRSSSQKVIKWVKDVVSGRGKVEGEEEENQEDETNEKKKKELEESDSKETEKSKNFSTEPGKAEQLAVISARRSSGSSSSEEDNSTLGDLSVAKNGESSRVRVHISKLSQDVSESVGNLDLSALTKDLNKETPKSESKKTTSMENINLMPWLSTETINPSPVNSPKKDDPPPASVGSDLRSNGENEIKVKETEKIAKK